MHIFVCDNNTVFMLILSYIWVSFLFYPPSPLQYIKAVLNSDSDQTLSPLVPFSLFALFFVFVLQLS